jgi:sigma-B regulation protein RsbU (phosphoserine phosphatase)
MPELDPIGGSVPEEFTIIGSSGQIIWPARSNVQAGDSILDKAKTIGLKDLRTQLDDALKSETTETRVVSIHDLPELVPAYAPGESYWVALAPLPATGWVLTAAVSETKYMSPIIDRLVQRASFLVAGLAVLLIVTTIVSIRVSRPIERMASAVKQLASGQLDAQVRGVHNRDEIGQLATAFNTMTRQLKSHVAALTEQTAARESAEAELRLARQIQTDLLPRTFPPFPDRSEFELHAVNVAAKRVAGDFFDFFFTHTGLLTIVIADVSGKGMPAAMLMAVTRTIVRNFAMEGLSPADIIKRANAMLVEDLSDSMFVTLFLCQYNPKTGEVTYVNAGHPRPYRIGADGKLDQFGDITGGILGVNVTAEDWAFDQRTEQLEVGQSLLLYTDGVTEARAPGGAMYREEGFESLLKTIREPSPKILCDRIVEALDRYQNGQPADDITVLALKRKS